MTFKVGDRVRTLDPPSWRADSKSHIGTIVDIGPHSITIKLDDGNILISAFIGSPVVYTRIEKLRPSKLVDRFMEILLS